MQLYTIISLVAGVAGLVNSAISFVLTARKNSAKLYNRKYHDYFHPAKYRAVRINLNVSKSVAPWVLKMFSFLSRKADRRNSGETFENVTETTVEAPRVIGILRIISLCCSSSERDKLELVEHDLRVRHREMIARGCSLRSARYITVAHVLFELGGLLKRGLLALVNWGRLSKKNAR